MKRLHTLEELDHLIGENPAPGDPAVVTVDSPTWLGQVWLLAIHKDGRFDGLLADGREVTLSLKDCKVFVESSD